jgi:hypothetical protein
MQSHSDDDHQLGWISHRKSACRHRFRYQLAITGLIAFLELSSLKTQFGDFASIENQNSRTRCRSFAHRMLAGSSRLLADSEEECNWRKRKGNIHQQTKAVGVAEQKRLPVDLLVNPSERAHHGIASGIAREGVEVRRSVLDRCRKGVRRSRQVLDEVRAVDLDVSHKHGVYDGDADGGAEIAEESIQ